jgi:hypothetical protein
MEIISIERVVSDYINLEQQGNLLTLFRSGIIPVINATIEMRLSHGNRLRLELWVHVGNSAVLFLWNRHGKTARGHSIVATVQMEYVCGEDDVRTDPTLFPLHTGSCTTWLTDV